MQIRPPEPVCDHPGRARLRHQEGAHDVHIEHAPEFGRGDPEQRAEPEAGAAPAGDVGHQGDRAELLGGLRHRALHRGLVGDVGLERHRPRPQRLDLGLEGHQVVRAGRAVVGRIGIGTCDVDAGDVGSAGGERQCRGPSDATGAGGAGDQRDPALEQASGGRVCETHLATVTGWDGVMPA